jgi:hypothetical protein
MIDKQAVALINRALELKWNNRYRLAWADDEFETRHRVLTLVDGSGNYTGEREETARLPKYSYLKGCFVLEKYFRFDGHAPREVKDWNGWEVIWAFEPEQNPNIEVCMFIANSLEHGVKRTLKDHYDEDKQKFDKEVEEAYEILDNESPYIATMLQNKEAIVVPEMPKDKKDA